MKTALLALSLLLPLGASASVSEQRCGWIENPSPENYFLVDQDGSWTIAVQGGYQAKGFENLPPLTLGNEKKQGAAVCACVDVELSKAKRRVEKIVDSFRLPATNCLNDQSLPKRDWKERGDKGLPEEGRDQAPEREHERDQSPERGRDQSPEENPEDPYTPKAEIQIFMDYVSYDQYSIKYVSTRNNLFSAGLLYPSEIAQNAACYKGSPESALGLFRDMVDEMNFVDHRDVRISGNVYMDRNRTGKPALRISARDEEGKDFVWFDRIRECARWSTLSERSNRL